MKKDKVPRGERNGNAKLTAPQILKIRASKQTYSQIAEKYDISKGHVCAIKNLSVWKHL